MGKSPKKSYKAYEPEMEQKTSWFLGFFLYGFLLLYCFVLLSCIHAFSVPLFPFLFSMSEMRIRSSGHIPKQLYLV